MTYYLKIPRPHVRGQWREGGDALSAPDSLSLLSDTDFADSPCRPLHSVAQTVCPTLQVNARECDKTAVHTKARCPPTPPPPGSR